MTKPVVLLIRDGWGHRDEPHKNAPKQAHTPFTDHLNKTYPSTLIQASEQAVGLPEGYFGNSEVGHMTIGAGDNLKQPLIRIQEDIEAEQFAHKDAFQTTYNHVESHDATLHIMGLVQTQGVHSHVDHLHALLDHLLTTDLDVELHLFTDGRDAPVRASTDKIKRIQNRIHDTNVSIASISGRYYAMDRDHRWDRTEQAYNAIHRATGPTYTSSALQYIKARHEDDETDEFTTPAHRASYNGINNDDDAVIFYNFRGDRPRQLTKAFIEPGFDAFNREQFTAPFTTMTKYYDDVKADNLYVAYDRIPVENPLGEILADKGLKQLRIAESEKFPHVTYFMNGRRDEPYPGEDQVHIPSPKVSTYDKQPEMSLPEVNERLLNELDKDKYDVVIVNYANGDMVGHTGDMDAAVKACEAVDKATKNLVEKVQEKNGTIFITADHGNCDIMEGEYRTSHTLSPVRFIDASSNPKEPRINGLKGIKEMILDEVA